MVIPVDVLARTGILGLVVVVKDTGELLVRVTGLLTGGTGAETLEPVGGQILRAGGLVGALEHGTTESRSHGRC